MTTPKNNIVDFLKEVSIFSSLDRKHIDNLMKDISVIELNANEIIVREGEKADACYILKTGVCQVYTSDEHTKEIILARLEPPMYFGEQAILSETPGIRSASVRSATQVTLIKVPHKAFHTVLKIDTDLTKKLATIGQQQLFDNLFARSSTYNLAKEIIGHKDLGTVIAYEANKNIVQNEEKPNGVYLILSGEIEITQQHPDQEKLVTQTFSQGMLFSENAIINGRARAYTALSKTHTKLLFFKADDFQKLYEKDNKLKNLIDSLKFIYHSARGGAVYQYADKFEEMDSITTSFSLTDRRTIYISRVIGENIISIRHQDMEQSLKHTYSSGSQTLSELFVKDGIILGAIIYGEWEKLPSLIELIFNQTKMREDIFSAFSERGELGIFGEKKPAPLTQDNSMRVCNCMGFNRGEIQACITEGYDTIESIGEALGAGTVCGSCVPIMKEMLGHDCWTTIHVSEARKLTDKITSYKIRPAHQSFKPAKPGQYIVIQAKINGQWMQRAYTLCSAAYETECYEIAIKQENNGIFSSWFNEHAKDATLVKISEPLGKFICNLNIERVAVCFVAGIGVTPAMSFLRTAVKQQTQRPLFIHYSVTNANQMAFADELDRLANEANKITICKRITSTEGRLTKNDIDAIISQFNDADYFICGPKSFEENIVSCLKDKQVSLTRINIEEFTPAYAAKLL